MAANEIINVPFEIEDWIAQGLRDGTLLRYGQKIMDPTTGNWVKHLTEASPVIEVSKSVGSEIAQKSQKLLRTQTNGMVRVVQNMTDNVSQNPGTSTLKIAGGLAAIVGIGYGAKSIVGNRRTKRRLREESYNEFLLARDGLNGACKAWMEAAAGQKINPEVVSAFLTSLDGYETARAALPAKEQIATKNEQTLAHAVSPAIIDYVKRFLETNERESPSEDVAQVIDLVPYLKAQQDLLESGSA